MLQCQNLDNLCIEGISKMKLFILCFLALLISPLSFSASPQLWAMDVGRQWGGSNRSYAISLDPFYIEQAAYPLHGLPLLWDAAYIPSKNMLFVSGGTLNPNWYSSGIAIYKGGPENLEFISLSNIGMENCHWLAGIEFINDNLYGIAQTGEYLQQNIFVRIDRPGTSEQTVVQIGPNLGSWRDIGTPFALCKDGHGNLLGAFGADGYQKIYQIDPSTGDSVLLHIYDRNYFFQPIEGMTLRDNKLYALTTNTDLYEIDLEDFSATKITNLGGNIWTALVAVPEPSMVLCFAFGILLFFRRRYK